jgi:hypothetical protein
MPTKLTYESVKSYIESKGDTLCTPEYNNNKQLLDIVCGLCTNKYSQTLDRFSRGHQHQNCIIRFPSTSGVCKKPVNLEPSICVTCKKEFHQKRIETNVCSVECSTELLRSDELRKIAVKNSTVEEWRLIEKAANYEVSNLGNIRSKITNKILKPTLVNGYLSIGLRTNDKTVTSFIHRLVATSFIVCPDKTYVVNHKDGIKTNNWVENLEWVSQSENSKHAYRTNLHKPTIISVSQYTLDDVFIKEYDSLYDAEWETGISNGHISMVCRGLRKTAGGSIWKYTSHVPTVQQPVPEGKTITGYPNYIITNDGRVYNSIRKKYLTPARNEGGYMFIGLSDNENKRMNFSIHRLVATMFLDNPNNHTEVNHIDYDKTNNNVSNLEWISRSDNMKHNFKPRS